MCVCVRVCVCLRAPSVCALVICSARPFNGFINVNRACCYYAVEAARAPPPGVAAEEEDGTITSAVTAAATATRPGVPQPQVLKQQRTAVGCVVS